MPRIPPNRAPNPQSQALLAQVKQRLGGTPNVFTTLAHSSATLNYYLAGANALAETSLSAPVREQIALTIAAFNQCEYCASAHTTLGKMHKLPEQELTANLAAQSSDARTQAALVFARHVAATRGKVTDADLKAVRDAGYDDAAILEIIAVTALNIFTNYVNSVAATEVDFPVVKINPAMQAA